jgi:fructose-1,6-bisphosphatase/inositol monophosphatase family enzyme
VSTSDSELRDFARNLAHRAGEIQLSHYDSSLDIREKARRDLVTEVDLLCEEMMISAIQEKYPEDSIFSEESGGGISENGRTWLLDPLDGTANYSRSNPLFCSCVSVFEGGRVTHTAIAAPRFGDLYHASLDGGAYRDHGGESQPLRVSNTEELEYAFTGADLSFTGMRKAYEGNLQSVLSASWQLRALGSAGIRGSWLAAGYLDVSLGTNNTAWDYAPAALLAAEAGGKVTDLEGEPWNFSSDSLLATNGLLHEEIFHILHGDE